MLRRIVVGLGAGVAFLVLDGVLNANPLARRAYAAYGPIAASSVNVLAGSLVDLAYGLILVALFVTLRHCLPGRTALVKGISFGAMVWFLRVVMRVAGDWVSTTVPASAHAYSLVAGLVQMMLVAVLIALLLPRPHAVATGHVLTGEAEATYAIAERLFRHVTDDELSWTPAEGRGWMTMGQLLMHCASFGCGKAIQGFVKGDWGPAAAGASEPVHVPPPTALPSVATVREALELLAVDRRLALGCIAAVGDAELFERRVAAPWGGGELPLFQQLLRMVAHLAQHKGQLFYYLKLMGKNVTTADLWNAPGLPS